MELWDLYAEDRTLTGGTHVRGETIPEGCYHLVVHVWIRNRAGQYLVSQRAADRPTFPLMWECVGGSVVIGEDSLTGAIREAKEEVGVDLEPEKGRVVFSRTRKGFRDIMDVWLFDFDGPVDLSRATTREVAQVHWMDWEQIMALYQQGKLVDTLEYFFTQVDMATPARLVDSGVCPTCFDRAHGNCLYGDPAQKRLYENELFECSLIGAPRAPGHAVIISKAHYKDMMDIPDKLCTAVYLFAKKAMNAIKWIYGAESVYLCTMCDGPMNHFHVQLIPRYAYENRGSKNFVKERKAYQEDAEKLAKLRELLKEE